MKYKKKSAEEISKEVNTIHDQIQPALYESNSISNTDEVEPEKELNEKILKITMTINSSYPELSKYLEEMEVTLPDEKNPEITLKKLKSYYNSLSTLLNKYILEHSVKVG